MSDTPEQIDEQEPDAIVEGDDGPVISDEEADALLRGVKSGEIETNKGTHLKPGEVVEYDLTGDQRIVRGRLPTLEIINDDFVRNFRISLFNVVHKPVEITSGGASTFRFADYIATLPMPTSLNIVQARPLPGQVLFVFDAKLVYLLVDSFFGGSGDAEIASGERTFTPTEIRLTQLILSRVFEDMKESWLPVTPLDFEIVKTETNPHFANITSTSDSVIVNTYQIELNGAGGDLHFVLPTAAIEPIRDRLDAGAISHSQENQDRWTNSISDRMQGAEVELKTVFSKTNITLGDLMRVQPGDVIPIDLPKTVTVCAGDSPVFVGKFGVSRGYNAVKVSRSIVSDENGQKA